MFNRAPSHTLKVFFLWKSVFCINSTFLFQQYTYFKICISKSFMRPLFFLPPFSESWGFLTKMSSFSTTIKQLIQLFLQMSIGKNKIKKSKKYICVKTFCDLHTHLHFFHTIFHPIKPARCNFSYYIMSYMHTLSCTLSCIHM